MVRMRSLSGPFTGAGYGDGLAVVCAGVCNGVSAGVCAHNPEEENRSAADNSDGIRRKTIMPGVYGISRIHVESPCA